MRFRLIVMSSASALALIAGCGGHVTCGNGTKQVGNEWCVSYNALPDPILGAWLRNGGAADRSCEFFGNGLWDNTCFIMEGWPIKWERIYENRYVVASTITSCDVTTSFSGDSNAATLTMYCGRTQAETADLVRIR